jgi:hypothetical protein
VTPSAPRGNLPLTRGVVQPSDWKPRLFVVVDTEEEFDWNAPFSRASTSVSALRHIGRTQTIFERFGIKPTYVIDYPVVTQPEGFESMGEIWSRQACQIGAHLHPWVTPPYTEGLEPRNSFACNLESSLQRAKLEALGEAIAARFDRPTIFKAGRYGLGAQTVAILSDLAYEIDLSVCPRLDFTASEGPSFVEFDANPFFLTSQLLEIPCTVDYVGWLGPWGSRVHRLASRPGAEALRAVGVLARLGAVNRVMLSPEGNSFEEMRALVRSLFARGCRTFAMSFHSPSVEPGHTPYVRSSSDLQAFLRRIEQFCEFFMQDMQGIAMSPQLYRQDVSTMAESRS